MNDRNHLDGLTFEEVEESRRAYGANELTPPAKRPIFLKWLDSFRDPCIVILCACATIAIVLGVFKHEPPWDGVAIFVAIAIATLGGTWSEYKADKAFELLKKDGDRVQVKVRRNGAFHTIASTEVVVGDIVLLESGDRIPADGLIAEALEASFDESLMTGESEPVRRNQGEPVVGGTYLMSGSATIEISKVGDQTELGVLASALGHPWVCPNGEHRKHYRKSGKCEVCGSVLKEGVEPPTPLQKRLAGLADSISIWGTVGAVLIFVSLIACRLIALCSENPSVSWVDTVFLTSVWPLPALAILGIVGLRVFSLRKKAIWLTLWIAAIVCVIVGAYLSGSDALASVQTVMQYFMVAVTIVVVAVPEGLPLAIVVALGLGMRKIREDNNLVRKMVAAETIGSATVICSDKTGTLTLNRMSVVENHDFSGLEATTANHLFDLCAAVNSTAELENALGQIKMSGSPTECALLAALRKKGVNYAELRDSVKVVDRISFSSERKMMSTLVLDGGDKILLVKGAPEQILKRCAIVPAGVSECIASMAAKAVRSIAFAYKQVDAANDSILESGESELLLLAVVGLADPVREDVPSAVARCRAAGIDVKMVTGDHPLTAHAIASKIGMLGDGDLEMTGDEFAAASDEDLLSKVGNLRVIARAKPDTKVRLVELLQRSGEVVAMTGDGTNDAPALKKADVGISMGLRGTDVAKQASDIVLTDDNFGSIIKAVHWGRTLYENLQKFVQFQLTVNLSALGIAFISPIVATLFPNGDFLVQPLTVLQYLWINLIMDTLAALAFGLEPPRAETLKVPPKDSLEPFITKSMIVNICVIGFYFIILILSVEAFDILGLDSYKCVVDSDRLELMKASVVFNCYVWFQIFHMFNARSVAPGASAFSGLRKSRSFLLIMVFVAAVQFVLVQFGGSILNTTPLPLAVWIKILLLGLTAVLIGEIVRVIQRSRISTKVVGV